MASKKTDRELEAFMDADIVEGRRVRKVQVQPRRALLFGASLVALVWLASDWVDELRYNFSSQEVTDLGPALDLPDVPLPLEAYVTMEGVLGNKAATISGMLRPKSLRGGPVQIRQMLGTPVFVEFDQDKYLDVFTPFTQVTVTGRLTDFSPGSELERVRQYFVQTLGADVPPDARLLIVDEKPGEMTRYPVAMLVFFLLGLLSCALFVKSSVRTEIER